MKLSEMTSEALAVGNVSGLVIVNPSESDNWQRYELAKPDTVELPSDEFDKLVQLRLAGYERHTVDCRRELAPPKEPRNWVGPLLAVLMLWGVVCYLLGRINVFHF